MPASPRTVQIQPRQVGVAVTCDVLVIGASLAAVSAAVVAAEAGRRVTLVGPEMHLGVDRTLGLQLRRDAVMDTALAARCFATDADAYTTPLRLKQALERAALDAGVELLLASAATDLLRAADGGVAGVLIANRAGRQALLAPVLVDATQHGILCPAPADARYPRDVVLRRTIIGGDAPADGPTPIATETLEQTGDAHAATVYHYAQTVTLVDAGVAAREALESAFREATDRPGQLRAGAIRWEGLPPAAPTIAGLLRLPWSAASAGEAVGRAAAALQRAAAPPAADPVSDPTQAAKTDLRERLDGLRPTDSPSARVALGRRDLPLLAEVDLLVVGGGTSGASAAIAGVRKGLRVLVLEYHRGLGGVGSLGLVNGPYAGRDVGHATEIPFSHKGVEVEDKMCWFHTQIRAGGGQIWYGCITWGAVVDRVPADAAGRTRVLGAAVATPWGAGAVCAAVVMDATGSADVAVAAGAAYTYADGAADVALQGTGMAPHPLRCRKVNSDYLFIDEHDIRDVTAAALGVRLGLDPTAHFDGSDFVQSRERRSVVGEFTISYLDQLLGRTYPDSIVLSDSDYDTHGYPTHPFFALLPHNEETRKQNHPAPSATPWTPYRCLLPRGLEGLLVVGIGISMERDAAAMVRMQRDIHNQAYAAALAAEQAIRLDLPLRAVDIADVQRQMIAIGALPEEVLRHQDNFPPPAAAITRALRDWVDPNWDFSHRCHALGLLWVGREAVLPELRAAYRAAAGEARLQYAALLGFWGQADGVADLAAALDAAEWDAKILQGMMAEYAYLPTPVDALVLALGYSGDADGALPPLLRKLATLTPDTVLSHHRSVYLALEALADPRAAEALAWLLGQPGMTGHDRSTVVPMLNPMGYQNPERRRACHREAPLRELTLARVLYRCGDHHGLGAATLQRYTRDLRGLHARHAAAVLAQGPGAALASGAA